MSFLYRFTGAVPAVFTELRADAVKLFRDRVETPIVGAVHLRPGDLIELAEKFEHALLTKSKASTPTAPADPPAPPVDATVTAPAAAASTPPATKES